jgi:transcriptional regulator with XRE-family HTH domain
MKKLDIKRALSEHNMTQADLYQKIGMSPQAICMIIKNNNPTVAKLMQIAEGIGCDITDLFYPDPSEEAEEREKALESAKDSKMPLELILRDLTRRAYPSITKEEIDEWMEVLEKKKIVEIDMGPNGSGLHDAMNRLRKLEEARKEQEGKTLNATLGGDLPEGVTCRDVNFVQQAEENQQQMIQTSTFCPHCGKKVRVGVVLLSGEC